MILTQTIEEFKGLGDELVKTIQLAIDEKGKTASGKTKRAIKNEIQLTASGVDQNFTAPSHWKYLGNGRGPGKPPPVQSIKDWLKNKQGVQELNAYAIAKKIGKEGSRDYRLKRPNIFIEEVEGFAPKFTAVLSSGLRKDITQEIYQELIKLEK